MLLVIVGYLWGLVCATWFSEVVFSVTAGDYGLPRFKYLHPKVFESNSADRIEAEISGRRLIGMKQTLLDFFLLHAVACDNTSRLEDRLGTCGAHLASDAVGLLEDLPTCYSWG